MTGVLENKTIEREIESDGYDAGRRWNYTIDTVEEFKTYIQENSFIWKLLKAYEITEEEWKKLFRIWKIGESAGISDDEWDSI